MNEGYVHPKLHEQPLLLPFVFKPAKISVWSLLEQCVQLKLLSYVDFALAEALLKEGESSSEALAALICHLSFCARQGHLCVSIKDGVIDPDPRELWLADDQQNQNEPFDILQATALLQSIYSLVLEGASLAEKCSALRQNESLFYLQKFWAFENLLMDGFKKQVSAHPTLKISKEWIVKETQQLMDERKLLPPQAAAVLSAGEHCLTLLTGGPGTGKTYTAGQMIKLIWSCLDAPHKDRFEIALAAPTGKAAANLQASLQNSIKDLPGFPPIKASTLHALLGVKGKKTIDVTKKLSADFILIDECSMIDIRLMANLFCAIKPGARLVLLGDRHQLPSVEAGSLFADFIDICRRQHPSHVVELVDCMRTNQQDLVQLAESVKCGHTELAATLLNLSSSRTAAEMLVDPGVVYAQLLSEARQFIKHLPKDYALLLQAYNRFKILTPLRSGLYGVEAINKELDKGLAHSSKPIILLQNDYRLDLFNGETGVLVSSGEEELALFPPRFAGQNPRLLSAAILPKYELAYCLSVHKSQGSEFEHVLMLVPPGSEFFGREVFYTAATRARQKLDVWGSKQVIVDTLARQSRRLSGFQIN
jgi:exodeoxyribonuclease V alpha subunit